MRPTTRFWTVAALAGVAGLWALLVGRSELVVAVCGVSAWLLAQQYRFLRTVQAASGDLSITQALSASRTATDAETFLTVSVQTEAAHPLSLVIRPSPPVAADGTVDDLELDAAQRDVTRTAKLTWPVAGTFQFGPLEVTARDRLGLFEQTFRDESDPPTITVEPRTPRNIHVGEGGTPVSSGFGEHESDRTGQGIEPAEVREYVAGDTFRQIDWKATARLNETHVREFTAQSDRETQLFVDQRGSMATGPPGETKFAYACNVAFAFLDQASEFSDPLGCYTIGEDGVTGLFRPSADPEDLRRIRRHMHEIEPGPVVAQSGDSVTMPPSDRLRTSKRRLGDDDSQFATRLAPFFDRPNEYVRTVSEQPLYRAVDAAPPRLGDTLWTVILSDDEHRVELRETVKLARQRGGPVLVFLTPTVLFEPGGLDDLDEAYEEYADFERFRRTLASLTDVSAFEVGPADRLSSVLANASDGHRSTHRSND